MRWDSARRFSIFTRSVTSMTVPAYCPAEIGSPVSIDNLKVHVMSIFDKYDLHSHELTINKAIKVEEEVYLKMKDKD